MKKNVGFVIATVVCALGLGVAVQNDAGFNTPQIVQAKTNHQKKTLGAISKTGDYYKLKDGTKFQQVGFGKISNIDLSPLKLTGINYRVMAIKHMTKKSYKKLFTAMGPMGDTFPLPDGYKYQGKNNTLYFFAILVGKIQNTDTNTITFNGGMLDDHYLTPSNTQVDITAKSGLSDNTSSDLDASANKKNQTAMIYIGNKLEKGTYTMQTGDSMDADYNETHSAVKYTINIK